MDDDKLAKEIDRTVKDLKDLKYRQSIGGDSWVVYRAAVDFTAVAYHIYRVDFHPEQAGKFVAKAYWTTPDRTAPGNDRGMHPDPNADGRWWMADYSYGNVPRSIVVYSTKKGSIQLTDISVPAPA